MGWKRTGSPVGTFFGDARQGEWGRSSTTLVGSYVLRECQVACGNFSPCPTTILVGSYVLHKWKCYGMSSELSYGTSTEISYGTSKNSRDYKSNNLNYCLQWLQYIPTRIIAKTSSTISLSLIIIGLKSQQLRSIRKKRRRQYRSSVQNASCQMDVRKIHGITCTKHLLRVLHPGRLAIPGTGYRYTYGLHPTPTGYMGGLHANRQ